MSYKNLDDTISPLVVVFNSTAINSNQPTPTMGLDTSLYQGTVSSNTLSIDYNSSLRGDFYGSTNASALYVFAHFTVGSTDSFQALELSAGYGAATFTSTEVFYCNPSQNENIQAKYRRNTASGITVTIDANFPRITGITTV